MYREPASNRLIRVIDTSLFLLLCCVIVLAPVLYGSTDVPIRMILEIISFIAFGCVALISAFGRPGPGLIPLFAPVLAFTFYLFVQILPIIPGQQFGGIHWRTISINPPQTTVALVEFLSLCCYGYLTLSLVNSKKRLIKLVNIIVILGFLLGLQAILQDMNSNDKLYWFRDTAYPILAYGGFVNKNHAAGYYVLPYALGFGLLLRKSIRPNRRIIYGVLTLITGVAVMLSRSRGGLVSIMVASLFMIVLNGALPREDLTGSLERGGHRWLTWKLAAAVAVFLVAIFSAALWINNRSLDQVLLGFNKDNALATLGGRAEIWRSSIQMIKDRPILGSGFGTFPVNFPRFTLFDGHLTAEAAHNDYLQVLCDTGIIGAIIATVILAVYAVNIKRALWSRAGYLGGIQLGTLGGIVAILIHSLFDFNLQIYSVALTFSVFAVLPFCSGSDDRNRVRDQATEAAESA